MGKAKSFLAIGLGISLLVAGVAQAQVTVFNLDLNGFNEPNASGQLGNGDPDGFASGTLTFNQDTDTLSWNFTYGNISGTAISGFHIHGQASPTQNTGIVIHMDQPLSSTAVPNGTQVGSRNTASTTHGGATVGGSLGPTMDMVLANPSLYYLNLHSSGTGGFPGGAVRAQLPEPGMLSMAAIGAMGLLARRRRA